MHKKEYRRNKNHQLAITDIHPTWIVFIWATATLAEFEWFHRPTGISERWHGNKYVN